MANVVRVADLPRGFQSWACSYADIARQVGSPRAFRAVGQANHNNPIAIIVPCHRVVGSSGTLGGYGGGLAIKDLLLRLEGIAGLRYEKGGPHEPPLFEYKV